MLELLQWAQVSAQKVTAQNVSSILLLLYFVAFTMNRKGFYIGAFLLVEFVGYSSLMDWCSDELYYLNYAGIYCACYWYEVKISKNIKILLAYDIISIDYGVRCLRLSRYCNGYLPSL